MDRLERVETKIDQLHDKMDGFLERTVKTESIANSNRGLIKIMLTGLLAGIAAVGTFIVRTFI